MDAQANPIAWLCPAMIEVEGRETWDTIRMNISGDFAPHRETRSGSYSRESTAPVEDDSLDFNSFPKLYLTFNPGPRGRRGFEFGIDPQCDIVLPKLKSNKISRVHCALTFDDQRRLILQDFSRNGTIVRYGKQGGKSRRTFVTVNAKGQETHHHFKWILGGDTLVRENGDIFIDIQDIRFHIKVFKYDENPGQYNINVDQFLQQVQGNDEIPLGKFSIQSLPSTAAPSGAQTPSHDPIRLKQERLGNGSFAVVRRYWDVSTGIEYAYKEPVDKKKVDKKLWEKEARIMNQVSHRHLVELVGAIYEPWPCLMLEYVPQGTLRDQYPNGNVPEEDLLTILEQSLSALAYLHGRKPPIAHRDIKLDNILVQSLKPLYIKLADFGLAKAKTESSFHTLCGTTTYAAPEIARYIGLSKDVPREKYTPAIDIWSLGVVVLECGYGLPHPGRGGGILWCTEIMQRAQSCDPDDMIDLLTTAMLIHVSKRESAEACLTRVLDFSMISRDGSVTPTPGSNFEVIQESRDDYSGQEVERQSRSSSSDQISFQQEESTILNLSSAVRRFVRSDAPAPSSCALVSTRVQKRPTRSSTSSSSSSSTSRHTKRHVTDTAARSNNRHPAEPEPILELFGEDWLQDPNCVGSFIAAMGEESEEDLSGWSSWGTQVVRRTETHLPRSMLEPLDENNDDDDLDHVGNAFPQNAYPATSAGSSNLQHPHLNYHSSQHESPLSAGQAYGAGQEASSILPVADNLPRAYE